MDHRRREVDLSIQPLITANVLSIVLAVALAALIYYNYVIWQDYIEIIAWAFLLSQALYAPQRHLLTYLRRFRTPQSPRLRRARTIKALKEGVQEKYKSKTPAQWLVDVGHFFLQYSFVGFTLFLFLSLLQRILSWVHILVILITTSAALGAVLYGQLWTYVVTDENMIALFLVSGALGSVTLVIVFLGIQSTIELYEVVLEGVGWASEVVYAHDSLVPLWNHSLQVGRDAFEGVRASYNHTPWWPVVETLEDSFLEGRDIPTTHALCRDQLAFLYSNQSWWDPADATVNVIVNQVNFDQLGTEAWRLASALVKEMQYQPGELVAHALTLVSNPIQYLHSLLNFCGNLLLLASNWGVQLVFFVYFLLVMLHRDNDILGTGITMLVPIEQKSQEKIAESLRSAMQGVFFLPIQLASIHSTIMFITLKLCRISDAYLLTSIIFLTSLLPLFSPIVVLLFICGCMTLPFWFGGGLTNLVKPIFIYAADSYLFLFLDEKVYAYSEQEGRIDSPLLSTFSMALGVGTFGWKGVVLGPLLLCLLIVVAKQRLPYSDEDDTPKDYPSPPPSPGGSIIEQAQPNFRSSMSSPRRPSPFPLPALNLSQPQASPFHVGRSCTTSSVPLVVDVALGSPNGQRYRVPVFPWWSWQEWLEELKLRLHLPVTPVELITKDGCILTGIDTFQPGDLIIIPDPHMTKSETSTNNSFINL